MHSCLWPTDYLPLYFQCMILMHLCTEGKSAMQLSPSVSAVSLKSALWVSAQRTAEVSKPNDIKGGYETVSTLMTED